MGGQHTQKQTVAVPPQVRDPNLWVVEALLPALLIVWLIMLAASRGLKKHRPDGEMQAG